MKTIEFRGYSDDTAGCYWDGGELDDDDCARGMLRVFHLRAGEHRMAISLIFGAAGMWQVGMGPIDDEEPMPPWPIRHRFDHYTAVLEIDVPDDAEIALAACLCVEPRMLWAPEHGWKKIGGEP